MLFFRRIIKSLVLTALIGFAIRKAMGSSNPKVQRLGHQANRLVGGFVGLDETGRRAPRRRRGAMTNTAGSALVGGLMSYFFDPKQGAERRVRAKSFAKEKLARRNGHAGYLPAPEVSETTGDAPYGARSPSAIT